MKLVENKIDELNLKLELNITVEDYAEVVKKKLNDYRRKAEFKGFRKGNVPMSLIQRVYGEQALGDSINDIISEKLASYVQDNNLHTLGEPILSEDQPQVEWKYGNEFNYKFDLGLAPEVNVEVTASDSLPYYKIEVSKDAKAEMAKNMLGQFGGLQETETAGDDDYLVVDFAQPAIENGITAEGVYVANRVVAESAKAKFVGAKAGDTFEVNVNEAFTNETDRAAMLKVGKETLATIDPMFQVTVINVKTFVPAESNQETWDKMFGEGAVKSEAEFDAAVEQRVAANYQQEADFRLNTEMKNMLLAKADLKLPEEFLKRWLYVANQGKFTKEDIEKEFAAFLADFKWQMVRGSLMQKLDLKVDAKDLQEAAEGFVSYQYAMYGMPNVPEQMLKEGAKNVLADERQARQIEESVEDQKVFAAIKEVVTLKDKKISYDKFQALS